MKNTVILQLAVLLAIVPLLSPASVPAEELKIGYVISPRLLIETEVGKAGNQELKKRLEDAQALLDRKRKEIQEFEEDIQRRLMVLSDEEKKKLMDEHERQVREVARLREDSQRDIKKAEAEVMGRVNEHLRAVIEKFGKDNGYDLILDANTLMYVSGKADITDALIKAADAAEPPGAGK